MDNEALITKDMIDQFIREEERRLQARKDKQQSIGDAFRQILRARGDQHEG